MLTFFSLSTCNVNYANDVHPFPSDERSVFPSALPRAKDRVEVHDNDPINDDWLVLDSITFFIKEKNSAPSC